MLASLACCALLALGAGRALAQAGAPAAPQAAPQAPPGQVYPAPAAPPAAYPQQAYPQQQPYPQQAYPQQQPYPQQAYPQQAYAQQAYPQQVYAPPYAPAAPRKPRLSKGLLVAGIVTLASSYGIALIVGASLVDSHCCNEVGGYMLVPVIGPYLAAGKSDDAKGILTLLGTVEMVGAGLLIGGIIRYNHSKREAEAASGFYSFRLEGGRTLSLNLATSPRLIGPTAQLKF